MHESDPDFCDVLKVCVQNLMNQGMVQFSRSRVVKEIYVIEPITIIYRKKNVEASPKKIQPFHICVPSPFTYQDTQAVPLRYDTTVYVDRKEVQISDPEIVNIYGTGGLTRSGHVLLRSKFLGCLHHPQLSILRRRFSLFLLRKQGHLFPPLRS